MTTPYALSSDLVSAWPAKSLAVAQYVDGYKLDTGPVQNAQTGTTYTFVLADTTKTVTANNSAASAYTIPPQSSVVWEAYTVLRLVNLGAGVVTLTAGAGVTLTGTVTVPQYGSVEIMRTASNAWTISGAGSAPGMDLITPTSVAGSGVTLSGGAVVIAAASTVSVNGCFSGTYANYAVMARLTHSAGDVMRLRLRASGTDNSAASYSNQEISGNGSTAGASRATGATSFVMGYCDPAACTFGFQFWSPNVAEVTSQNETLLRNSGGSPVFYVSGGIHNVASAFDGLTMFPDSGTVSGTIRVYGLRN